MYSLFLLLTLLTVYFFFYPFQKKKNRFYYFFGLFSILNLYTHYHAIIVLCACALYSTINYKRLELKKIVFSFFIIGLFYSFLDSRFLYHLFEYSSSLGNETTRLPSIFGSIINPLYLIFCFSIGQSILPVGLENNSSCGYHFCLCSF